MNSCRLSLTYRCVRMTGISAFVVWFALLAIAPPKIRHEHPVAESSPSAHQHVHHDHSHHGHHHHHPGQPDTARTLTPPLVHWHVWLAGVEWTIPAGENPSDGPEDESAPLVIDAVVGHFTPTISQGFDVVPLGLISIPQEFFPTSVPPARLWRDPGRTGPPLCDAARGLRSGVRQV